MDLFKEAFKLYLERLALQRKQDLLKEIACFIELKAYSH